jgi:hypothetical protein
MHDVAGVFFIVIVFGGGMLFALSRTPLGLALAERIRGRPGEGVSDPALVEEVERLRHEMVELQERMDFAERLLAQGRDGERLSLGDKT